MAVDAIQGGDSSGLRTLGLPSPSPASRGWVAQRRAAAGRRAGVARRRVRPAQPLYEHLQSLELGFFDRQQTGQLMSRATVDLQSVRFFLGYGLVFILQSALTICSPAVAMIVHRPGPRASSRCARCRSWSGVALRYGRRSRPALQEVQQRIAELTAEAEENIGGVRVVKAFAQEERQLARFRSSVGGACSTSRWSRRGCARSTTRSSASCPSSAWPRCCSSAAARSIDGHAHARRVHRLLRLPAHAASGRCASLGISLGLAQRATASGARMFEMLDREPRARRAGRTRRRCPPAPGACELRDVTLRYEGAHRAGAARRRPRRRGRHARVALVGGDRLGQDDARRAASRGCTTRREGAVLHRRRRRARRSTRARCARAGRASSPTTRSCSRPACATTSPTRGRRRRARRSSWPRGAPRRTSFIARAARRLRHARRRARADALAAASASASRSPARCSPTRAS